MSKVRRFDCVNIRTGCKLGLHPDLYCNGTCKRYKKDPQFVEFPGWVQTASGGAEVAYKVSQGEVEILKGKLLKAEADMQKQIIAHNNELAELNKRVTAAEGRVKELEAKPKEEIKIKNKPGRKPKIK